MKNMKVRTKMLTGFILVTLIGVLLGAAGITAISMIKAKTHEVEDLQAVSSGATNVLVAHYIWRHGLTEAVLTGSDFTGSLDPNNCALGKWLGSDEAKSISDSTILDLLRRVNDPHHFIHTEAGKTIGYIQAGEMDEAKRELIGNILPRTQEVISLLTEVDDRFNTLIDQNEREIESIETLFTIIIIVLIFVAVLLSVFLTLYISGLIGKPLTLLASFMHKAGATGDLTLRQEDVQTIGKYAQVRDEIGDTIGSTASFIEHITEVSQALETIAGGDLTANVKLASEADTMGVSLKSMVGNLNNMFNEIRSATSQVNAGSKQIADGAQALAAGTTEQASSVQELAASLNDVSTSTNQNADMAKEAADLSNTIKTSAERGSVQMDQMMQAVTEINDASSSISKVIKVIDDIAFQTNILALNAAVEAARAGQHGKGFAVVAEEVRNLAAKSAEAAKDTSSLIENSIEKANFGMSIATETSESLHEIVEGINRNAEIIIKIEESSENQAKAISQISLGIDQVAQVVQQNSATAEESAAASEEMSGQAAMLEQLISQFKLKDADHTTNKYTPASTKSSQYTPAYEEPAYIPPAPSYTPPAPEVYSSSYDSSDKY